VDDQTPRYPMRVVTRLTGLTPDVVRVWQRRYGAVDPGRTEGNARRYSEADVRRLGLLKRCTERGHAIGAIATLPDDELARLAADDVDVPRTPAPGTNPHAEIVDAYLDAIEILDVRRAARILASAAALLPGSEVALEVVAPVLRAVGARWHEGRFRVLHEHLASAQVRALLPMLASSQGSEAGERVVIATPQGERHEFGALIGALLAAARGFDVLYLGADLPADDLLFLADHEAHLMLLSVVWVGEPAEIEARRLLLRDLARRGELWIGMPPDHPLQEQLEGVHLFHRFEDLDTALAARARGARRSCRARWISGVLRGSRGS